MKRILAFIIFYGSFLTAMNAPQRAWLTQEGQDSDERVSELILACAHDQGQLEELKIYLNEVRGKIVTCESVSYQGATLAAYLAAHDPAAYPHLDVVQQLLEGHTLRVLILKASKNSNEFEAFRNYFDAHPRDIDACMLLPEKFKERSLGGFHFWRLCGDDSYLAVCRHVESYRSNSPFKRRDEAIKRKELEEYKALVNSVVKGHGKLQDLQRFLRGKNFNIDALAWDERGTVGEFLKGWSRDLPGAALLLNLPEINQHRTNPMTNEACLNMLLPTACRDLGVFEAFKKRFQEHPQDADQLVLDDGRTLGDFLDQCPVTQEVVKIAHLVQGHRTHKNAYLRNLFARYEHDKTVLTFMRSWILQNPRSLSLQYDSQDPQSGTFADFIKRLNDPELSALLRPAVQPQPQQVHIDKARTWFTTRNIAISLACLATVVGYYLLTHRAAKKEPQKQERAEAVS